MKFGSVPIDQALGTILAHSVAVDGGRLRKGKVLAAEDIAQLAKAGIGSVVVARLEDGDIGEDAAAARIGAALVAEGLHATPASAGRVNIVAERAGVVKIDVSQIEALNLIEPGITVATVPQLHRVQPGDLICTVKIIPYAVAATGVAQAERTAANTFRLAVPIYKTATLIETAQTEDRPADKGRRVLAARLGRMGLGLTPRVITPHEPAALAWAMRDEAPGDVLFVLTDTATSDERDVGPQALIDAGGTLTRFGIPVDPGNLLYLGHLHGKPVIGLPGCARSPALNGADWVLERVLCGIEVTSHHMAQMGLGGLLKEMPSRPRPRQS